MKKPFFYLIISCLLLANSLAVVGQQRISFQEQGYDNMPVYGLKGNTSYYFRLPRDQKITGAVINIYIQASQVLNPDLSYIDFRVDGEPVAAEKLLSDTGHYILPVPGNILLSDKNFLKLDIISDVHITSDRCQDMGNAGLWIKILNSSFVDYNYQLTNSRVKDIAQAWYIPSAIVYPDQPTAAEVSAATWLNVLLQKEKNLPVKLYSRSALPDSVHSYLEIGTFSQLQLADSTLDFPAIADSDGLICLHSDGHDSLIVKNNKAVQLYITGANDAAIVKAAEALLSPGIRNSAFSGYLAVDQASLPLQQNAGNDNIITFRQLGGVPDLEEGIGSLKKNYTFSMSDFRDFPDEVEINISAKYSALMNNDNSERGYFNLYINGALAGSQKLDESGKLIYSTIIRRFQLRKFNTLTTEFVFYPSHEACINPMMNYFASIDVDNSAIILQKSYQPHTLSFYHFPQVFTQHPFDVVVSDSLLTAVPEALSALLMQINQNDNQPPVYPVVQPASDYQPQANHGLIAFLTRDDSVYLKLKNLPVKVEQDFNIYNGDHSQVLYSIHDTAQTGLAQIFYSAKDRPALIFTAKGNDPEKELNNVSSVINDQLADLSSNVAIATGGEHLLFNIQPTNSQLTYTSPPGPLLSFWYAYKIYILLLIILLVIIAFLFIRKNVKTSRESFNEV